MPKARLEFNLPDDQYEYKQAVNGSKYASIIYEWTNYIRTKTKHGDGKPVSWETVKDDWWSILQDENVDPYKE